MESKLKNSFAVVAYIRSDVAVVVDGLRADLTPGCPHRAHVTILRPRELEVDPQTTIEQCRRLLGGFRPFRIELGDVSVFDKTEVIKIDVVSGLDELLLLHKRLNSGSLEHDDKLEFTPHVTLCQDVPEGRLEEFFAGARRGWDGFSGERGFLIESLTLVQQREDEVWVDLAELPLVQPEFAAVRRS